jgi:hypothetical protein
MLAVLQVTFPNERTMDSRALITSLRGSKVARFCTGQPLRLGFADRICDYGCSVTEWLNTTDEKYALNARRRLLWAI